ncbi:MAG: glutamate formimidoyltransferase [Chloroflexi bacterium]|nr:glutamate formimidoyltransferase [Chloroflexota bacterium]
MNKSLVECVPNFSEGRRMNVVNAITDSIAIVPQTTILDRHIDPYHNRTVITFVGPPTSVEQAAFQAVSTASKLIDMNQHNGAHPRIGATDVVPFVPLSGASMETCIQMSEELGNKVGSELNIPVYLYGQATDNIYRSNLANLRSGGYEGLRKNIATNPERHPDYGPNKLSSSGATAIGARSPLIAFNINLSTDDVIIAKKIAKSIRQSSGGLHGVQSIGIIVDELAQVSNNITNYAITPVVLVVDAIEKEATKYGVKIHNSEIVGLIPQEAMKETERWYLPEKLELSTSILEYRIEALL